ncbi:MAG: amidohydrolase [Nitrospinota bacterium]
MTDLIPTEEIRGLAAASREGAVALRRDLHRRPEPGWLEFRTTARLAEGLEALGLPFQQGREVVREDARLGLPPDPELAGAYEKVRSSGVPARFLEPQEGGFTGLVAVLDTGRPGPTVGLRFDIDANAGEESRDPGHLPAREGFRSENPGFMHNCAHDGHAAMGLTTARILSSLRGSLSGRVKFIFQPAEEGARGAHAMAAAGVVDDVDVFLAAHIGVRARRTGRLVCGATGFQATTKLDVRFLGRSAHAGLEPEKGRNALLAAANAVVNLYALPRHSAGRTRINVGRLEAGEGRNIVPARAFLQIETRGATTDLDAYMRERALEVLRGAAALQGVEVEIEEVGRTVGGDSDPALARLVGEVAADMGEFDEIAHTEDFGASDDAVLLMERVKERGGSAVYVVLGSELPSGHHTPSFDFNEDVLVTGPKLLSAVACRLASEGVG